MIKYVIDHGCTHVRTHARIDAQTRMCTHTHSRMRVHTHASHPDTSVYTHVCAHVWCHRYFYRAQETGALKLIGFGMTDVPKRVWSQPLVLSLNMSHNKIKELPEGLAYIQHTSQ